MRATSPSNPFSLITGFRFRFDVGALILPESNILRTVPTVAEIFGRGLGSRSWNGDRFARPSVPAYLNRGKFAGRSIFGARSGRPIAGETAEDRNRWPAINYDSPSADRSGNIRGGTVASGLPRGSGMPARVPKYTPGSKAV